jgi:type IV secretion system protein VirB8
MNKRSRETLDTYYKEAESWAGDRQAELRKSRKTAWMVAAGAGTIALLEALALVLLLPLKTVEPLTLLVDKNTGYVQAVRPLDAPRISGDTALTQSLLVQYVTQREGFDINSLQQNYRNVTLWSAGNARAQYIAGMQASNPQSPLARFARSAVVEVHVRSVSPMPNDTALVRFETRLRNPGGQTSTLGGWVATIRYRFVGEPMKIEDRFANPLGFQVVHYQKSQEALGEPETPAPAGVPGAATAPGLMPTGNQPTGTVPNIQRPQAVVPPQPQRQQQTEPEL